MGTKKAVVIGGSNGIGLAIAKKIMADGYYVDILDIQSPENKMLPSDDTWHYEYCDLLNTDESAFDKYVNDDSLTFVMITAGMGRVADFEYLHPAEIEKLMGLNATGVIKAVRYFYKRCAGKATFRLGLMGSIAGLVSSPMFSVYAASKAALCRFTESVNIELEAKGTANRITNICPGSIKGTKFNGGSNDLSQTEKLAEEIIAQVSMGTELYVPDENDVYHNVLKRYAQDAHAFGVSSYEYKKQSGRVFNENRVKIGYLSGTFDLFHIGHLNLLRRAKEQCDYLIVGVHNSGAWKGKETFIPFEERKEIVGACQYVDRVVESCREDCDAWDLYHYNRLFVGSDYKGTERFNRYEEYFKDKGVEIIYFPYTKSTSSTQVRNAITCNITGENK